MEPFDMSRQTTRGSIEEAHALNRRKAPAPGVLEGKEEKKKEADVTHLPVPTLLLYDGCLITVPVEAMGDL